MSLAINLKNLIASLIFNNIIYLYLLYIIIIVGYYQKKDMFKTYK